MLRFDTVEQREIHAKVTAIKDRMTGVQLQLLAGSITKEQCTQKIDELAQKVLVLMDRRQKEA